MQENSERGQQVSASRIADLEREACDTRDIHLSLAAQHESKVLLPLLLQCTMRACCTMVPCSRLAVAVLHAPVEKACIPQHGCELLLWVYSPMVLPLHTCEACDAGG